MYLKLNTAAAWGMGLLFLLATIAALYLGKRIFIPLIMALLLAAMLWPMARWMHHRGVPAVGLTVRRRFPWVVPWQGRLRFPWGLACLLVVTGSVLVVLLIAFGFGVALSKFVIDVGNPDKVNYVYKLFRSKLVNIWPAPIADDSPYFPVEPRDSEVLKQISAALNNRELLQHLGLESASFLWDCIIITFVLLFLLIEGPMLNRNIVRVFGPSPPVQSKVVQALTDMGNQIRAYLVWRTLININLALFLWVLYSILGLSQPWTWALLSIVLFYIPYLGPIFAGIGPIADAFISCDPWVVPTLLIVYTVLVILEGYWIVPVVMGRGMELNATTVMLACLFWELVWGTSGLFLAMPLMAAIKTICAHVPDWEPWANLMGTRDEPAPSFEKKKLDDGLDDTQLMTSADAEEFRATREDTAMGRLER